MTASEEMKVLLDKINLLFNVFDKDGIEHISALEKELLKEQVNKLLQHIDQLGTKEEPKVEMVAPFQKLEELAQSASFKDREIDETPVLEAVEVAMIETIEVPQQEVKALVKEESRVEVKVSMVDSFMEKKEAEKKSSSSSKPTRSLQQIIDLNKSFVLKAELFNNNHSEYSLFIDRLNQIEDEGESQAFVEKEAQRMSWNKEEKAYELIVRAVEKRFLPILQQ